MHVRFLRELCNVVWDVQYGVENVCMYVICKHGVEYSVSTHALIWGTDTEYILDKKKGMERNINID